MTTKKATSSQQVLLSAKKLAELGNELTDIMNVLEMNNLALEGLEFALQKDTTMFLWLAKKYTDTAYAQNEKLYDRLNEIAFLLLNNDDAKELEAYAKDIKEMAQAEDDLLNMEQPKQAESIKN